MNDENPGVDAMDVAAAAPLDHTDTALLAEIAALLEEVDPLPADLVERVQFALALDEMFTEVAQITRLRSDELAVRSEAAEVRTETLTFSADRLTAMVTVTRDAAGRLRVDGWIAPEGVQRVQLRMPGRVEQTLSDESGRFVFEDLPDGFAQLTFRPDSADAGDSGVVTPLFQL